MTTRALVLAVVLLLSACASTPPALIALPAAPQPGATPRAEPGPTILLRRVTVPGYLDGFAVVTGRQGETLVVAPGQEWAERLSDGAARVLRDALSRRLGAQRVLIEGDGRIPDADLTVELLALDPRADKLMLDSRWSFVASRQKRVHHSGRTQLDVPLNGADAAAVAAATARALGELADVLAREASALELSAGAR